MGKETNILILDDHMMFRESISRLLAAESDFRIVGTSGSVEEALDLMAKNPVDVVLLDYDLGEEKGTEFLSCARQAGFAGRVLVVTAGISETESAEMICLGIAGIVRKHSSPATLAESIRHVRDGKDWFEQGYLRTVLEGVAVRRDDTQAQKLTERERQVLQYVFEGLANKQIADKIQISESSVKGALQQLFAKTGVRTRSQLVRVALDIYKDEL